MKTRTDEEIKRMDQTLHTERFHEKVLAALAKGNDVQLSAEKNGEIKIAMQEVKIIKI